MSFVCLNFNFCGHPVVRSPNNYYSPHHSSISTVILFIQHALLKGPCNHAMDEFSTRAVAKISSCRVYAISRRGIGINLGFWKLPTYPSPKPTLSSSSQLGQCWLRGGVGGQFARNLHWSANCTARKYSRFFFPFVSYKGSWGSRSS